jgi:GNAT superfamily N-acetyltransferase
MRGRARFAVLEFIVRPPYRGRRLGSSLMRALLVDRPEPVATLCSNPLSVARQIYAAWGRTRVGISNPPRIGPMDVLVKELRDTPKQGLAGAAG